MPLLTTLLEGMSVRAGAALPYIESLVAKGLGTEEVVSALKAASLSFRRTDMLSVIREVSGVHSTRDYLTSIRNDFVPDPARLAAPVSKTLRAFSFRVAVHGTDADTGEKTTQHVTISTSDLMTVGDMKQRAIDLVEEAAALGLKSGGGASFEADSAVVLTGTMQ